jgi:hypothetical protein
VENATPNQTVSILSTQAILEMEKEKALSGVEIKNCPILTVPQTISIFLEFPNKIIIL